MENDIYYYIEKNDPELLKEAIKNGVDIHKKNEINGENALFKAGVSLSKILIDAGIDINHLDNKNQNAFAYLCFTPFEIGEDCYAAEDAENKEKEKFKLLLDSGVNPYNVSDYNENAYFVCHDAEMLSWLFDLNVDLNLVNYQGHNLLWAVNGKLQEDELTNWLIKKGVSINTCNNENSTLLFYNGNYEKIRNLINAGLDVNHINNNGDNFLTNGILRSGSLKAMKMFIDRGLNIHHVNKAGLNILDIYMDEPAIAELLCTLNIKVTQPPDYYNDCLARDIIEKQRAKHINEEKELLNNEFKIKPDKLTKNRI